MYIVIMPRQTISISWIINWTQDGIFMSQVPKFSLYETLRIPMNVIQIIFQNPIIRRSF